MGILKARESVEYNVCERDIYIYIYIYRERDRERDREREIDI